MKVAIVAPESVPYVQGGAENLYQSLCEHINNNTPHSCEIITLPSPESNFKEVLSSYKSFLDLKLENFDQIISGKYPSWMISHRNHVCYMLHPLRGLYDTYHMMNLPTEIDWDGENLTELKGFMDELLDSPKKHNDSLDLFFNKIQKLVTEKGVGHSLFAFPGPFVRYIVHFLDSYALSSKRISKYFAISSTVAKRSDYFPVDANVKVLHPSPLLKDYKNEKNDYVFTVSRLDSPKRIGLIIEAFKMLTCETTLIIAGDGPQKDELARLAGNNERIIFTGRVSDKELIEYYANALTVVYVPHEEDYGYITIEAMKSSKPVITTVDSGGPNEFVQDGVNGFSVKPVASDISNAIDYFIKNKDHAIVMGERAKRSVKGITWGNVVDELLVANSYQNKKNMEEAGPQERKKIVVLSTFNIYPPMGGGQARIFNLYKELAHFYDIEIVSLCNSNLSASSETISQNMVETRVPVSDKFIQYEQKLSKSVNWAPVTDIAAIKGYAHVEDFVCALKKSISTADIVISSHPFMINAAKISSHGVQIWFEAHNVELDLKTQLFHNEKNSKELLELVTTAEKECWLNSDVVFGCTHTDLERLEKLYGKASSRPKLNNIEVPNGVDFNDSIFIEKQDKELLKEKVGIKEKNTALFVGSWHGPNIEAAKHFLKIANDFPDVHFFIIGSVGLAVQDQKVPDNVTLFGELEKQEKQIVMSISDVALNPMVSGSGSNLKVFDYFAHGIPVISTPFGMRGLKVRAMTHFIESDLESFSINLSRFYALYESRYSGMRKESRDFVKKYYSWDVIAKTFYQNLKSIEIKKSKVGKI